MTDFYDDLFLISLTAFTSVSFACASLAMLKRTRERSVMLRILVAGLSMLTMGSGLAICSYNWPTHTVKCYLCGYTPPSAADHAIGRVCDPSFSPQQPIGHRPSGLFMARAIAAGGAAHLAYVAGLTARGDSEWVAVLPAVTAGLFLITAFITWGGVNVIRPDPARSTGILDRETEPFRPQESGYDEGEKMAHPAAASMAEISASLSPPLPVSSASPESPRSPGTSPLISAPSVQAPSGSTSSVPSPNRRPRCRRCHRCRRRYRILHRRNRQPGMQRHRYPRRI